MDEDSLRLSALSFMAAVARLEEALNQPFSPFVRDSVIKRFEISWELGWKLGQKWLRAQGIFAPTPKASWGGLIAAEVLANGNRWSALQRLRNLTTHLYSEALAQEVYEGLADQGLRDFQDFATWAKQNIIGKKK